MIRNCIFRYQSLDISYFWVKIKGSGHFQLAIYTVFHAESESAVRIDQFLHPEERIDKNQPMRVSISYLNFLVICLHIIKICTGKPPRGNRNHSVYRLLVSRLMLMLWLFVVGWLSGWACWLVAVLGWGGGFGARQACRQVGME